MLAEGRGDVEETQRQARITLDSARATGDRFREGAGTQDWAADRLQALMVEGQAAGLECLLGVVGRRA